MCAHTCKHTHIRTHTAQTTKHKTCCTHSHNPDLETTCTATFKRHADRFFCRFPDTTHKTAQEKQHKEETPKPKMAEKNYGRKTPGYKREAKWKENETDKKVSEQLPPPPPPPPAPSGNLIIIIIIIAFQGAIRDYLQSPHSAAKCLQHVRSSGPGAVVCKSHATHRALITCNMLCYVPLGTKGQLSY